jgi:diguanylate cyclase (GGDEF)-like protein
MSLRWRLTLLLAAVLLIAGGGSLLIHTYAAQQALQAQLELRNRDAAASLALALSQQQGDAVSMQAVAAAQFDLGAYRRVQLLKTDGSAAFDLQQSPAVAAAPAWFVATLPLHAAPGRARVVNGWAEFGRLEVQAQTAWAHDSLWEASSRTALMLTLLALAAGVLATWALRAWLQPLQATVAQARALEEGRFVQAPEPAMPELQGLTRSMNGMVQRLRDLFAAQAEQVAVLQRQAQHDTLTGLPLRRQFLGRLGDQLQEPAGPGVALVLVRVLQLDHLNQRLGRDAADGILGTVAGVLEAYVDRARGTFAGRLNGSDFALCLPLTGLGAETAASLHAALTAAPALSSSGAEIAMGVIDGVRGVGVGAALAAADAALARAEAQGGFHTDMLGADTLAAVGSRVWREQIGTALSEGRAELAQYPVIGPLGQRLRLECPLRVQLAAGQDFQAAARWLALARRSRLMPQVDLMALGLALQAVAADGLARTVHVSWPSLAATGFVAQVTQALQEAPAAARSLSIEWVDSVKPSGWQALAEATRPWRSLGVQVGVAHAGGAPQHLVQMQAVGIDYVKIDPRHLRGVGADEAVRAYAQSLVALVHGLQLQAVAAGVDSASDLRALWALGFDACTGPAVTAAVAVGQPSQA